MSSPPVESLTRRRGLAPRFPPKTAEHPCPLARFRSFRGRWSAMLTDHPPRSAPVLAAFLDSDRLRMLEVPQDDGLRTLARSIEEAMQDRATKVVRQGCAEFLRLASDFYG